MNWTYKNEEIEDISNFPKNTYGFIYKITHTPTNKIYIGRKVLYHNRKVKLTKKDLALYEGSNKPLLELLKSEPKENFTKDVLMFAPTKKLLTYYETQVLFVYRVLEEPEMYYNDNILGKFFRRDFDT